MCRYPSATRASLYGLLAGLSVAALAPAPSARAAELPFVASLAVQFGLFEPIGVTGSGIATVNGAAPAGGSLDQLALPPTVFDVDGLSVPVTGISPIEGVQATFANASGDFDRSGGALGGPMALNGVAKVCLFLPCSEGPPAILSVPLDVIGVGGTVSVSSLVDITITGAPWTTGAVTIDDFAMTGFARGPNGQAGTTAQPGGIVRLVTPIFLSTNIGEGTIPAFGILTLQFVPELGTLALLGSGILGLAALGRSRRASA